MIEKSMYDRTSILLGDKDTEKLKNMNICLCGIGGVGSFVFEALVRIGIENITIIDKDTIDITNINRQLMATSYNIGEDKVCVAKKRAKEINPNIHVLAIKDVIDINNVSKYITRKYDYVIDAIDSVESKIAIIKRSKELGINIISSMGMANRLDPTKIKVAYIENTIMCPLAKIIRKRLKEENITKVKVVFSNEPVIKTKNKILGSVPYVPSVAGLIIAAETIKDTLDSLKKD